MPRKCEYCMIADMESREIVSLQDARLLGLKYFFTGVPCRHGHIDMRQTSNRGCVACSRARVKAWAADNSSRVRECQRKSYHKNRDKNLRAMKEWRLANLERERERVRRYQKEHADIARAATKAWVANNRDHVNQKSRERYARLSEEARSRRRATAMAWEARNKDAVRKAKREWKRKNPEGVRAYVRKRTAMRYGCEGHHTQKDIHSILVAQRWKCANCRVSIRKKRHIDHIVPLSRGGSNNKSNLQGLCPACNMKKSARDPIEFAQMMGKLL